MSGLPAPSADAVPSGTGSTIGAYPTMLVIRVAEPIDEVPADLLPSLVNLAIGTGVSMNDLVTVYLRGVKDGRLSQDVAP